MWCEWGNMGGKDRKFNNGTSHFDWKGLNKTFGHDH